MQFLSDLWHFMLERRKFWLAPVIVLLLVIGILIIVAETSAIGAFVYTIF